MIFSQFFHLIFLSVSSRIQKVNNKVTGNLNELKIFTEDDDFRESRFAMSIEPRLYLRRGCFGLSATFSCDELRFISPSDFPRRPSAV